jgi:hypothetical protein
MSENSKKGRRQSKSVPIIKRSSQKPKSTSIKDISVLLLGRRTGLLIDPTGVIKDKYGLEDVDSFWASEETNPEIRLRTKQAHMVHPGRFEREKIIPRKNVAQISKVTELSYTMKNRSETSTIDAAISLDFFDSSSSKTQNFDGKGETAGKELVSVNFSSSSSVLLSSNVSTDSSNLILHQTTMQALNRTERSDPSYIQNAPIIEKVHDTDTSASGESNRRSEDHDSFSSLDALDLRFFDGEQNAALNTPGQPQESLTISAIIKNIDAASGTGDVNSEILSSGSLAPCGKHFFESPKPGEINIALFKDDVGAPVTNAGPNYLEISNQIFNAESESITTPNQRIKNSRVYGNVSQLERSHDGAQNSSPCSVSSDMELISPSPARVAVKNSRSNTNHFVARASLDQDCSSTPACVSYSDVNSCGGTSGIFDDLLREDETVWSPSERLQISSGAIPGGIVDLNSALLACNPDKTLKSGIPPAMGARTGDMQMCISSSLPVSELPVETCYQNGSVPGGQLEVSTMPGPMLAFCAVGMPGDCTATPRIAQQSKISTLSSVVSPAQTLLLDKSSGSLSGRDECLQSRFSPGDHHNCELAEFGDVDTSHESNVPIPCSRLTPRPSTTEINNSEVTLAMFPSHSDYAASSKVTGPATQEQPKSCRIRKATQSAIAAVCTSGLEIVGRSRRQVIRPLQFWRHERVEYLRASGAPTPEICTVVFRSPEQPASGAAGGKKRAAKSTARRASSSVAGELDFGEDLDATGSSDRTLDKDGGAAAKTCIRKQVIKRRATKSGGRVRKPTPKQIGRIRSAPQSAKGRKRATPEEPALPAAKAGPAAAGDGTRTPKKIIKRRLYEAAMKAFHDDRFDDGTE